MSDQPALVWLSEAPGTSKGASNRKIVRTNAALRGHSSMRSKKLPATDRRKYIAIRQKGAVIELDDDEEDVDDLRDPRSLVEQGTRAASGIRVEEGSSSAVCLIPSDTGVTTLVAHPTHTVTRTRLHIPPTITEKDILSRLHIPFTTRFGAITGLGGREWLLTVGFQHDDALLRETLETFALGLCARGSALQVRKRYTGILARFQHRLDNHRGGSAGLAGTLSLTLILSLLELIVWDEPRSWIMHLEGMAVVVRVMGPGKFAEKGGLRTLRWFRRLGTALGVLFRRASFMADPDWLTIPWSIYNTPKDKFDLLIDILIQAPGIIAESDQHRLNPQSTTTTSPSPLDTKILTYTSNLRAWAHTFLPSESPPGTDDEATNLTTLLDTLLTSPHPDHELTQPVAHYICGWLMLPRFGPQYNTLLPLPVGKLVEYLLRLCERFAYDEESEGLMPWSFPTRMAFFTPGQDVSRRFFGFLSSVDRRYAVKIMGHSRPAGT